MTSTFGDNYPNKMRCYATHAFTAMMSIKASQAAQRLYDTPFLAIDL